MANNDDGREARKHYMHHRQTVIFTITGTILAVALCIACLFFFHVGGLGEEHTVTQQADTNFGEPAPCVSHTADNEAKPKYLENKAVTVRVLNGTKFTGFAQAVAQALENREFVIQGIDNYKSAKVERTTIVYGKNAIAEAYTLASNFTDAKMVMDDRSDKLIDVIVGATFSNLKPTADVPKTGTEIQDIQGCKALDTLTKKLPKAPDHTAV